MFGEVEDGAFKEHVRVCEVVLIEQSEQVTRLFLYGFHASVSNRAQDLALVVVPVLRHPYKMMWTFGT